MVALPSAAVSSGDGYSADDGGCGGGGGAGAGDADGGSGVSAGAAEADDVVTVGGSPGSGGASAAPGVGGDARHQSSDKVIIDNGRKSVNLALRQSQERFVRLLCLLLLFVCTFC